MTTGTQLRDRGVTSVSRHFSEWKENGLSIIASFREGMEITSEEVREWVGDPPTPNAMGGLFIGACRLGLIEKIGYRQSKRPERHAGVIGVYRKKANPEYERELAEVEHAYPEQ